MIVLIKKEGKFEGAAPLQKQRSSSPLKERDTRRELKRDEVPFRPPLL